MSDLEGLSLDLSPLPSENGDLENHPPSQEVIGDDYGELGDDYTLESEKASPRSATRPTTHGTDDVSSVRFPDEDGAGGDLHKDTQDTLLGGLSNFSLDLDDLADDNAFPSRLTGRAILSRPSTGLEGLDGTLDLPDEFNLDEDDDLAFYLDDDKAPDTGTSNGSHRLPEEVQGVKIRKNLVSKPRRHVINPLVDRHVYSKIGKNKIVEAHPPVVHFAGLNPDEVYTQKLKLTNISSKSVRIQLVEPSTPYFKIQYNRKGLIAPGMSEDIQIEFQPHDYRYFHDALRVHCAGDKLLVPIHGYPIMNKKIFPSSVKFGRCRLLYPVTKTITMTNTAPLNFEFEIKIREANSSFSISPKSGRVPANGKVDISITFTPVSYSTQELRMSVAVSQFNLKPIECVVTAACAPDDYGVIDKAKTDKTFGFSPGATLGSTLSGGGKGKRVDFVSEFQRQQRRAGKRDPFAPPQQPNKDGAEGAGNEAKLLLSQTGINKILSAGSTQGRARVAAVKQQETKARRARAAAVGAGSSSQVLEGEIGIVKPGDTITADSNVKVISKDPADVAELHFLRALKAHMEYEKAKEIKAVVAIGEPLMSLAEMKEVKQTRTRARVQELAHSKSEAMARTQSIHSDVSVVRHAHQSAPAVPSFNLLRSQSAADRISMYTRFMRVLQTHLVRTRADIRLRKIRKLLQSVDYDKDKLRELVAAQASMSLSSGAGAEPAAAAAAAAAVATAAVPSGDAVTDGAKYMGKREKPRVYEGTVRLSRDKDLNEPKKVPVEPIPLFEDCPLYPLRVPQESTLKGYHPVPFPEPGSYQPIVDRTLRTGAEEEYPGRAPRGTQALADPSSDPSDPSDPHRQAQGSDHADGATSALPRPPTGQPGAYEPPEVVKDRPLPAAMHYLLPTRAPRVQVALPRHCETDLAYPLRPRMPPAETGVQAHEQPLGTTSILALSGHQTLSHVWVGKYEHVHLDSLPAVDRSLAQRVDTKLGPAQEDSDSDSGTESDEDDLPPLPHPDQLIESFYLPPSVVKEATAPVAGRSASTQGGDGSGEEQGVRFQLAGTNGGHHDDDVAWRTLRERCETELQVRTRAQRLQTASALGEIAEQVRAQVVNPRTAHLLR